MALYIFEKNSPPIPQTFNGSQAYRVNGLFYPLIGSQRTMMQSDLLYDMPGTLFLFWTANGLNRLFGTKLSDWSGGGHKF